MWTGVPVVTLAGWTHVSRCGASVLSGVGCSQWFATTADEYVRIARGLAGDLPALVERRRGRRVRVASSPLNDVRAPAAKLEAAYRAVWENQPAVAIPTQPIGD
jgi:protein O-GlcNAc transferase